MSLSHTAFASHPAPVAAAAAASLPQGAVQGATRQAVYSWSIPNDKLEWTAGTAQAMGLASDADISSGRAFAVHMAPETPTGRMEAILNSPSRDHGDGVPYKIIYALRSANGLTYVEDTGRWFGTSDGRPLRAHGVLRVLEGSPADWGHNVDSHSYDVLTGQLSRAKLNETLEIFIAEAIQARSSFGFVLMAISDLAHINESYGFDIADELIGAVGRRLREVMRGGDILGRHSGNKFGIIMRDCEVEDMKVAADRLLATLRAEPIQTSVGPLLVNMTAGGVMAPRHAQNLAEVNARAQEALGQARHGGRRGSFSAYAPNLERDEQRRANIRATDEIIAALNDGRINLAFQPIVAANGGGPDHYECLLRVHRVDGSLIPAGHIVPLAEKLGLIRLMDARVLDLAVQEMTLAPHLHLSVNVSPASTADPEWMMRFEALMQTNAGVAERTTIEITETAAIADLDDIRRFVARVRNLGAKVAIDDFGAGYTSFRNLRQLGVDSVKIDGAYVQNMSHSSDDLHFVTTLVGLAKHMGLKVVAEWVQSAEDADTLRKLGCDYFQGIWCGSASEERPWTKAGMRAANN